MSEFDSGQSIIVPKQISCQKDDKKTGKTGGGADWLVGKSETEVAGIGISFQFVFGNLADPQGIDSFHEPGGKKSDSVDDVGIGRSFLDKREGGLRNLHVGIELSGSDRKYILTVICGTVDKRIWLNLCPDN